jgi:hypothetical protein
MNFRPDAMVVSLVIQFATASSLMAYGLRVFVAEL